MRMLWRGVAVAAMLGLLTGGVMLVRADDKKAGTEKKEKKEGKGDREAMPGFPDIEDLLKKLGAGLDDEQMKDLRKRMKEMRERMEQLRKQMRQGGGFGGGFPGLPALPGGFPGLPGLPGGRVAGPSAQEARLGAVLNQPSQTLIDQLDLPKDQGLVLGEVGPNSPAAKAGLKAHDILLEVNGKAVPSKKTDFDAVLKGIEADKAVDVVVMRKGKKETIKGVKLPAAKVVAPGPQRFQFPGVFPRLPNGLLGDQDLNSTILTRENDKFTVKHRGDGESYTVKGKVTDGKAEVSEVTIESNGKTKTYSGIDAVPAEYQGKVKKLAGMAGGGGRRLRDEQ